MTFPSVVFGSALVTAPGTYTYTDGDSLPANGFILYVVPTINMKGSGIDIGFIYVNQFGVTKTTTVSTSIPAYTTAGTPKQVVLEPGDTGIRDIISISYFSGGTAGDSLNFESWNEGLGKSVPINTLCSRQTPGYTFDPTCIGGNFLSDTLSGTILTPRLLALEKKLSYFIQSPNPIIPMQIPLKTMCPRPTPGYPIPPITCPSGDFMPDTLSNRQFVYDSTIYNWMIAVKKSLTRLCARQTPGYTFDSSCIGGDFVPTFLTGNQYWAKYYPVFRFWLESVVGQVVSGYVTNLQNQAILNAVSLVIISTGKQELNQVGIVNPATGFYQIFVKGTIYDKRYVIIQISTEKSTSLVGGGIPSSINGNSILQMPYNLQFICPSIECDFDLTKKV